MAKQFTPDEEEHVSQKKSSQQRLLLLLLLLIGLFAYLYFFTGLIKPREEAAAPQPTQPAPAVSAVVKKPLPPRPQGAATSAQASAKPAGAQATPAPVAANPAAAPAKPAQPAGAAPAGAPAVKPATKPAPAAAAPAKPAPAPAVAAKEAKPAAAKETKPAAAAKEAKPAAGKEAKPASAAAKPAAKEAKPVAKEAKPVAKEAKPVAKARPAAKTKPAGAFALELDSDIAESEVTSVTGKLNKAGIAHVVTTKLHKGEPMHRLFLADFGNHDEAAEELGRLKGVAPNAFMLKESGRYAVYAGSFMREGKAAVEQDRLYDKGVRLVLKKANIPVTVVKVRAGSFSDPTSAEKAAANLKKTGLSAKVVKAGK